VTRAKNHLIIQHAEDPLLQEWNQTFDDYPKTDGVRRASQYLYEGELGISYAVADALLEGQQATITARATDVANRYIQAKGQAGNVKVEAPAHLAAVVMGTPLNNLDDLKPGVLVWSKQ